MGSNPNEPTLRVEPAKHDLGSPVQFEEVRRAFVVRNTGSNTVTLEDVVDGHSCSAAVGTPMPLAPGPKTIAPGESLALELRCRPRMHGVFLDQVRLRTDAAQRELRIPSSGRVIPAAVFERNLLEVQLPFGARRVEEVRAKGARSGDLELRLRPADQERWRADGLSVTVLPAGKDGVTAGLRIQLDGRRVGKHAGTLVAETGLEGEPREIMLPYAFHVPGTLSVEPEPLYVNLRAAGEKGASLEVRSTQPDFEVHAIRVLEGPFEVTRERVRAGHYRATVRVLVERLDRDARGVVGRLEIRSNDRTEPRKKVPLFAFGKPLP